MATRNTKVYTIEIGDPEIGDSSILFVRGKDAAENVCRTLEKLEAVSYVHMEEGDMIVFDDPADALAKFINERM